MMRGRRTRGRVRVRRIAEYKEEGSRGKRKKG
jgi:hypothetical protein